MIHNFAKDIASVLRLPQLKARPTEVVYEKNWAWNVTQPWSDAIQRLPEGACCMHCNVALSPASARFSCTLWYGGDKSVVMAWGHCGQLSCAPLVPVQMSSCMHHIQTQHWPRDQPRDVRDLPYPVLVRAGRIALLCANVDANLLFNNPNNAFGANRNNNASELLGPLDCEPGECSSPLCARGYTSFLEPFMFASDNSNVSVLALSCADRYACQGAILALLQKCTGSAWASHAVCGGCGAAATQRCAGCLATAYCSDACASTAWPSHKKRCRRLAALCRGCGAAARADGGAVRACKDCRVARYCGRGCQRDDYRLHRALCQRTKRRRSRLDCDLD